MTEEAKVWFYFIFSVILLSKHLSTVREKEAVILYAILKGYKFSVGKIIENSILSYYRGSYKGLVLHPALITRLCILGGMGGGWGKEETCPKVSPLTLTGITKWPNNKGKDKEVEAEKEEGDNRDIEQVQFESLAQEYQERQRSLSPIMIVSLELREIHQEPTESSEHQSNNVEVMEMLRVMRQEKHERDRQLKIQLQLRDEYMDAELRIRDQNLEDALKQRDEEWKSKLEKREK